MDMKRRAFSNKVIYSLTAVFIMIIILGGVMQTKAANTSDDPWTFSLTTNVSSPQFTGLRPKQDYSRSYCNWTTKTGTLQSIYIMPYGSHSTSTSGMVSTSVTGGYYIMRGTGKYFIRNYTKENGYSYECLGMKAASGSGTASGFWSPDSAYTGTDITSLPY